MTLQLLYGHLLARYGPQGWWPADTPFEVMVGAILTQNTAWTNVEKAMQRLKSGGLLDARHIHALPAASLADILRPTGYFNLKAVRLQAYCGWYLQAGGFEVLKYWSNRKLRATLLDVPGIGPETADDILLYAFKRPVFVIDAYTRRLLARLGLARGDEPYEALRARFEAELDRKAGLYQEYHALIVEHAKQVCRPRPRCTDCVVRRVCAYR